MPPSYFTLARILGLIAFIVTLVSAVIIVMGHGNSQMPWFIVWFVLFLLSLGFLVP